MAVMEKVAALRDEIYKLKTVILNANYLAIIMIEVTCLAK